MTPNELQFIIDGAVKPPVKKRIWELDALRGLCVVLMVIYHFLMVAIEYTREWYGYTVLGTEGMAKLGNFAVRYMHSGFNAIAHPTVVYTFILLCGFSCGFSRSNLKRGLQLAVVSLLVTIVTVGFGKGSGFEIRYGILHLLSTCILIWSCVQILSKNDKRIMLIAGVVLGFIVLAFYSKTANDIVYTNKLADKIIFLTESAKGTRWSPCDFFPLIPWSGVFFFAAALSAYIFPEKKSLMPKLDGKWNSPLCFFGRHALFIYCLHTVIYIVAFELIGLIFYDGFVFI